MNGVGRAVLAGAATGSRSMSALAATARCARRGPLAVPAVERALTLAQVGELIGDKLPQAPSRLEAAGLITRLAVGALVGALAGHREGSPRATATGGVAGFAAAGAAAVGGARARALLSARFGSDLPGALLEDVVAIGLAETATRAR